MLTLLAAALPQDVLTSALAQSLAICCMAVLHSCETSRCAVSGLLLVHAEPLVGMHNVLTGLDGPTWQTHSGPAAAAAGQLVVMPAPVPSCCFPAVSAWG
jgi:hypothetical protein